jgi:hypothetical protein
VNGFMVLVVTGEVFVAFVRRNIVAAVARAVVVVVVRGAMVKNRHSYGRGERSCAFGFGERNCGCVERAAWENSRGCAGEICHVSGG